MAAEADNKPYELHGYSRDAVRVALSNHRCKPTQVAGSTRVEYLLGDLESSHGINAKTFIVEYNYTDGDYLDDFAAYYVTCFSRYERRCKRLHFFDVEVSEEQFRRLIRGEANKDELKAFQKAYIGFIVARPLPEAIVGRTVLRTYEQDGGRRNYPATCEYKANLFGIPLKVRTLAFQEQDTVLAACATVALWSSFQKTAELFGTPAPRPAAITDAANQLVGQSRPIPSRGLVVEQIATAIRAVGLEPEIVEISSKTPLVSLLRGYLKFGLPVILGVEVENVGLHAMTLTGYSLNKTSVVSQEAVGAVPMVGMRINKFYAHDDQIGPFASVEVKETTPPSDVFFHGSWVHPTTGKVLRLTPKVVIIPMYNKIRVTFLDIQKWVTRLSDVVTATLPTSRSVEWSVHLITTNDLKKALKDSLPIEGMERFRLVQHPRFIWRVILNVDGDPALELLADATDMERSMPIYSVIWHNQTELKTLLDLLKSDIDADRKSMVALMTEPFYDRLRLSTDEPWHIVECWS